MVFNQAVVLAVEQRLQRESVAVDAAEDRDTVERPLDLDTVLLRRAMSGHGGASLLVAEFAAVARRSLAELLERHQPLAPGRLAAMIREGHQVLQLAPSTWHVQQA